MIIPGQQVVGCSCAATKDDSVTAGNLIETLRERCRSDLAQKIPRTADNPHAEQTYSS